MARVVLKGIVKTFDEETVIDSLNLYVPDGSFTVLVGPSGCGKTTTLRIVAGLEKETQGEIWIGNEKVNDLPPGKRDVAMVFQNYALYPTMTVRENIEFGLKNRKVPKGERRRLISEIAEIVGLGDYLDRKPGSLSGGQRQRVALARAMVKKPQVFLLDEPLSNLDAKMRHQMREELKELHRRLGTTFIYVTHDQVEAMSLGDQIVVMNKGEIQQAAPPLEVYRYPANLFTARFIGSPAMNILSARVCGGGKELRLWHEEGPGQNGRSMVKSLTLPAKWAAMLAPYDGSAIFVGIRPEKIRLEELSPVAETSTGWRVRGTVGAREILGAETVYQIESEIGLLTVKSVSETLLEERKAVRLFLPYGDLHFFDRRTQRRIGEIPRGNCVSPATLHQGATRSEGAFAETKAMVLEPAVGSGRGERG
ncbi:sn-glycerol-3-phosphate ABC transporter ATP-binding protein UgpC [Bacillaceae bacterium]